MNKLVIPRGLNRVLAISALSMAMACSSSSQGSDSGTLLDGGGVDAGNPDAGPALTHNTFVAKSVTLPGGSSEANADAFDLNGDGTADNHLGQAIVSTSGGIGTSGEQADMDSAVSRGDFILLFDLQTSLSSSAAKLVLAYGDPATAKPTPCADAGDTVCGQHLQGTGVFTLAPGMPPATPMPGTFDGDAFDGGTATLMLPVAFLGSTPVLVPAYGGRARIVGASSLGLNSIIVGGAILESDIDNQVLPSSAAALTAELGTSCTTSGDGCTCTTSLDTTLDGLFDTSPKDCVVTRDELVNSSFIQSVLAPDLTVDGGAALSFGEMMTAVPATFPTGN